MEWIVTGVGTVLLALVGLLWRNQGEKVEQLDKRKQDVAMCEERHASIDARLKGIEKAVAANTTLLINLDKGMAVIVSHINGVN